MIETKKLQSNYGTEVPKELKLFIDKVSNYALNTSVDTFEVFFSLFNIICVDGFDLRYYNTPIEFFPFAGNGSGGEHFGHVIHFERKGDYKTGYFDPINSDEVEFLGNNTAEMIQNLLTDEKDEQNKFYDLIEQLNLNIDFNPDRFELIGSVSPDPIPNFKWKSTTDGIGVLAKEELFNPKEISRHEYKIIFYNRIREFMNLALENKKMGYYGTALYFLKELYYYEWTDFEYAITM